MNNFPTESDELRPLSGPRNGEGFGNDRNSRGKEPLAIHRDPIRGRGVGTELLRASWFQGQEPLAIHRDPIRGLGVGTVLLRALWFQGQRAPGYSPRPHAGPTSMPARRSNWDVNSGLSLNRGLTSIMSDGSLVPRLGQYNERAPGRLKRRTARLRLTLTLLKARESCLSTGLP